MTAKSEYVLPSIAKQLGSEASAFAWLAAVRWPEGAFCCPGCGATRALVRPERLAVQCRECAKIVSVRVGTLMHGSRQPLATWVAAAAIVVEHGTETVAAQLQRTLGIGRYEVAYYMLRKLLGVMSAFEGCALRGSVTVEEYGLDPAHDVLFAVETAQGVAGRTRARVVPSRDYAARQRAVPAMVDTRAATIRLGPRTKHRFAELRTGKQRLGGIKGKPPPEVDPIYSVIHSLRPMRAEGQSLADALGRLNEFCFQQEFRGRPDEAVLELLDVHQHPTCGARRPPHRK